MEEVQPQDMQEVVDANFQQEERPDQALLRQTVEKIEAEVGEFDFDDVQCVDGEVIQVGDSNVTLDNMYVTLKILDKGRGDGSELFKLFFVPAALTFIRMIKEGGFNVCRPIGITNPNLTAENGTLQLCHAGDKISVRMQHKYHQASDSVPEAYTQVTLETLMGVSS